MTIVVSWLSEEREFPILWTVTDSLLLKPNNRSSRLFEYGAKLFPIRIGCLELSDVYDMGNVHFTTTIGMAFAGSSLIALNLYAFLGFTLGNLSSTNFVPLSLGDYC